MQLFIFAGSQLKDLLKEYATEKCHIDRYSCNEKPITLVPIHLMQQNPDSADEMGHFHTRDENAQIISEPSVGNVSTENLFNKANDHAKAVASTKGYTSVKTHKTDIARIGRCWDYRTSRYSKNNTIQKNPWKNCR